MGLARIHAALMGALLGAGLVACGGHVRTTTPVRNPAGVGPGRAVSAPSRAAVLVAPVRVAATTDGRVGYRSVGTGPPVLLVMGFDGTLDDWTPGFEVALARTHRVITFDNAGIGATSALSSPLTITAMAGQTAALLDALHVAKVDVLGWSMGGMIAQALAVEHPGLVSQLVLAATLPGDGSATAPSAAVMQRLADSVTDPADVVSLLFPSAAADAADAYVSGVFAWPDPETAPPAVSLAQGGALRSWVAGDEPVGRRIDRIAAPTLVADGSEDVLVPGANVAALHRAVHSSRVVVYPGAGHAFLFQDQARFLEEVAAFFG